ncbi:RNA polymerase subunit sigma [Streptomyces gelaticus]|uniref:RNA polymerase subunit sigma n=1 Tax=Streptomyces gelaticus TaxID=285446 RepID=A0ABQ2W1Y1_9ACTN|nr:zf-HC2 domain-containing protein [Streptomyces gelaticus]GGV88587.1 RNA polymerase subunit sigma [Streptomyces gelaticus]
MNDDHEWEPFGLRPTSPSGPGSLSDPDRPRSPGEPRQPRSPHRSNRPRSLHRADDLSGHDAAGAYLLGVLDDAEAAGFEAHLAECELCAARLDELAGLEPVLATLARPPAAVPAARLVPHVPGQPGPRVLARLVDEVAAGRARRRRRAGYLVAAAVALIVGGPVFAVMASGGDGPPPRAAGPYPTGSTEDALPDRMPEEVRATDPLTEVEATIGMARKPWGTSTVLELGNVTGPQKCTLIAVSKTGEEEVVTSWSVPERGYGIEDSPYPGANHPLRVQGGTAMDRGDIDHFEVRTSEGRRLVEVDA